MGALNTSHKPPCSRRTDGPLTQFASKVTEEGLEPTNILTSHHHMNVKECPCCKQVLSLSCFRKRNSKSQTTQSWCKICSDKASKLSRSKNPQKYNKLLNDRRHRNRDFVLSYLKSHPCVDCGESNPVVLDFDHINGSKTMDISLMVSQTSGINRISSEIEKCEVRCANCHRIATAKRNPNHWVNRLANK